ncbi:MAG: endonuclease III [Erysipelotrichaceae bacterium]|nr:endonuclease III [Erysipelotrichaceae bacterium]
MNSKAETIMQTLDALYPDADCELHFKNVFELLIAVTLSAQTTDVNVNRVTPELFRRYPDPASLAAADPLDVMDCIRSLGLYRNKAANIIRLSNELVSRFNGEVPNTREELTTLPGVGRKTANVVMAVGFHKNAIAVDTHVERVSKRLCIADLNDDVLKAEEKLMAFFPENKWGKLHHQLLFFGRYTCKARKPACEGCPLKQFCRDYL